MVVIRNLEGLNRLSRGAWFVLGLICFGLVGYVGIKDRREYNFFTNPLPRTS